MADLATGLYDRLLDEELSGLLADHPELVPVFEKLDPEGTPDELSQLISRVLGEALQLVPEAEQLRLTNRMTEVVGAEDGAEYTLKRRLLDEPKSQRLTELKADGAQGDLVRPETPLGTSSLLTGAADDPSLDRELRAELVSSDRVDILVSFI